MVKISDKSDYNRFVVPFGQSLVCASNGYYTRLDHRERLQLDLQHARYDQQLANASQAPP